MGGGGQIGEYGLVLPLCGNKRARGSEKILRQKGYFWNRGDVASSKVIFFGFENSPGKILAWGVNSIGGVNSVGGGR